MNYNNLIIALLVVLVIVIAGGIFFVFNGSANTSNETIVNNTNNTSSSVNVEQVNTEEVSGTSNTHIVMGEDGYYHVVDDNGNILETLGPSKKYYPNNPSSVDYPNAEPMNRYLPNGKP